MHPVHLARINYSGDLGYEIWMRPEHQRVVFDRIVAAGEPHGLRLFGMRALMSLRLEKSYGTWFREYRPIYRSRRRGSTATSGSTTSSSVAPRMRPRRRPGRSDGS